MQSTWTWSQVITNLKGITAKTSGNTSQSTSGKWGVDTTNGMWMYIPSNAYYSTGHWLNVPWNTCSNKISSLSSPSHVTIDTTAHQSGWDTTCATTVPYSSGHSQVFACIDVHNYDYGTFAGLSVSGLTQVWLSITSGNGHMIGYYRGSISSSGGSLTVTVNVGGTNYYGCDYNIRGVLLLI